MLYFHCSDAAMALQLVQNGSLSPKQATVLCLNHESLHTSTLITNLWAWFVGVASNIAPGLWVWSVGVALVPEGSQKVGAYDFGKQGHQERASQEEQIDTNFSSIAPSSEELWVRKDFYQNALL